MSDYIVRAAAADLQIRAFAITSKELVERARSIHNTSPVATAALGRLLSAGAMMGAMMKGENDLLTLQIKGDGPIGGITVKNKNYVVKVKSAQKITEEDVENALEAVKDQLN